MRRKRKKVDGTPAGIARARNRNRAYTIKSGSTAAWESSEA